MMKVLLLGYLFCVAFQSSAQSVRIVDKKNQTKIPYPTITVIGQKYSFNASQDGAFSFQSGIYDTDSLLILKQGFEPLKTTVNEVKTSRLVELVNIQSEKKHSRKKESGGAKRLVLNEFDKNKVHFYVGLEKPTEQFNYLQIAQKYESPADNAVINEVAIGRLIMKGDGYIVNTKLLTRTKFLLRIYDVDSKTGGPGNDLCSEMIEVHDLDDEVVNVDLRKYGISIPGKYFFIGVEWLRIDYNGQATLVGDDGNLLSVTASSKSRMRIYQPFIGMSNVKGSQPNSWVLTYNNRWKPYNYFAPYLTDFAISTVVSY